MSKELHEKYSELIEKCYLIPAGMALTTQGGSLKAEHIVHVIEPEYKKDDVRRRRTFYRLMV